MANLSYGETIQIDTEALPAASLFALAQRGLNHELGNVVSSKVVGKIRSTINENKPSDVSTDAVKVWRAANADKIAEWTQAFQAEAIKAINEGTLGVRAASGGGASVDPLTREMRAIAKQEIVDILAAGGMKFPGVKDGKPQTVTLKGTAFTGVELIDRRLVENGEHRDRIEKKATGILAARKREAEKNAAGGLDSLV